MVRVQISDGVSIEGNTEADIKLLEANREYLRTNHSYLAAVGGIVRQQEGYVVNGFGKELIRAHAKPVDEVRLETDLY